MNFKEWFYCEAASIAQMLKKTKLSEELNKIADSIFNEIFVFTVAKEKADEIKNWIIYQIVRGMPELPTGHIALQAKEKSVSRVLRLCRDFLAVKYETINFKDADYSLENLKDDNDAWHRELSNSRNFGSKGAWGKPIINFSDGWSWVSLGKASCPIEGGAMGHCGNAGGNREQNILSLRNPKNVPYLTFIDNGGGVLGEMKGRSNNKPERKYHKYIIELIKNPMITNLEGGGYADENNFSIYDLTTQERNEVYEVNPKLKKDIEKEFYSKESNRRINHYGDDPHRIEDDDIIIYLIENNLIMSNLKFAHSLVDEYDYEYDDKTKKTNIYKSEKFDLYVFLEYRLNYMKQSVRNYGRLLELMYLNNKEVEKSAYADYADLINRSFRYNTWNYNLMNILYKNDRNIFDYFFSKLNDIRKNELVYNLLDEGYFEIDDKYLDYLSAKSLETMAKTGYKTKSEKLKNMMIKNHEFPKELEKERGYYNLMRGLVPNPTSLTTGGGYGIIDRSVNEENTKIFLKLLWKVKNNKELTEEEDKILKYSFGVQRKTLKEILDISWELSRSLSQKDHDSGTLSSNFVLPELFPDLSDVKSGEHSYRFIDYYNMIIKLLNGSVVSHIGYGSYSNIFNRTDLELFMAILKVVFNKKIKVSLKTKKLLYNIARKTYDNLKPEIIKLIMRNAGFPVIPTSYPSSVNADNLLNKLKNLTIPEIESYFMNIKLFDDDKENLKGLKKLEKIIYSNVF